MAPWLIFLIVHTLYSSTTFFVEVLARTQTKVLVTPEGGAVKSMTTSQYIYTHIHMYIYTYMYIYVYTYIHAYIQRKTLISFPTMYVLTCWRVGLVQFSDKVFIPLHVNYVLLYHSVSSFHLSITAPFIFGLSYSRDSACKGVISTIRRTTFPYWT